MGLLKADEKELEKFESEKWKRVGHTLLKDWRLYTLLVPMLVFLFLFKYLPVYGVLQGFKKIDNSLSVMDQKWQGLYSMKQIIFAKGGEGQLFWQAFRNTFVNSMYGLLIGFPIPIILALFFTEIKNGAVRSVVQVCVYLPKFLSTIVTATIISVWCRIAQSAGTEQYAPGLLTKMLEGLKLVKTVNGHTNIRPIDIPRLFRPIYQVTGIWEGAGYGSIVYFAAALAIDPTSYEAAKIDGASKMQQIRYVTLPGMTPTLAIMLIIRIGQILHIGYEKILLLMGSSTSAYETADVISTWVYRKADDTSTQAIGIVGGLLESVISMILVLGANKISKQVSNTSLF